MRASILSLMFALSASLVAQDSFAPARYEGGSAPVLPAMAVGGGQVLLELSVGADGVVTSVKPLRTTPPFTELLTEAARGWRFHPAEETQPSTRGNGTARQRAAVASTVLVAGVFRPPTLNGPTLGQPPAEAAPASEETALPTAMTVPPFPPQANRGGVVLLEARVDQRGGVDDVKVLRSAPPFDDVASRALAQWSFRSARLRGTNVPSLVYVVFGFPAPVTVGTSSSGTLQ